MIIGSQVGRGLWGSLTAGVHATGGGSTRWAPWFHRGYHWVHHSTVVRRISVGACRGGERGGELGTWGAAWGTEGPVSQLTE